RRHTRSKRDWSSDVCSSDLPVFLLFIIDKIDNDKIGLKVRKLNLKDTYTYVFLIIITAFLILPYFKNINMINWKNLLFIDVYDRSEERRVGNEFILYCCMLC